MFSVGRIWIFSSFVIDNPFQITKSLIGETEEKLLLKTKQNKKFCKVLKCGPRLGFWSGVSKEKLSFGFTCKAGFKYSQ